jgi:hypothetical protein
LKSILEIPNSKRGDQQKAIPNQFPLGAALISVSQWQAKTRLVLPFTVAGNKTEINDLNFVFDFSFCKQWEFFQILKNAT